MIFSKLFKRGKIGNLEIDNRIVKAATGLWLANPDGSVTERLIRHYEEVARGGTGLVIVECSGIDYGSSKPEPWMLSACGDEFISGLGALAQAIGDNGARSALQIVHFGRDNLVGITRAKAPSRIPWWGNNLYHEVLSRHPVAEELTIEEIRETVRNFGEAARRAEMAGFDMVEVHGAHGTLITNFLSPAQNRRNDLYGGSFQNRLRFLIEVIADIRSKVSDDFLLCVRLSGIDYEPGGIVLEDTLEVAKALERYGVDVIHISGGSHVPGPNVYLASPMGIPEGHHIREAAAIKQVLHIPVIASGSITTPELAEKILQDEDADFIALARPLFADPHWPEKAKEGRPEDIRPCIRCNEGCQYRSTLKDRPVQCSVNVILGKEDSLAITPAKALKNVAIIGGGPAGMEAAVVCATRGHEVTLFEREKLGGALHEASVPEFKSDIRRLITYYITAMEKLNIKVMNKEADVDTIRNGGYDAAIVAVGAAMTRPDMPGLKEPFVTDVLNVLGGNVKCGQKVCVIGGGMIGVEVGLFLAEQGKEIVFTTRQGELMSNINSHQQILYDEMLARHKVTAYTDTCLQDVVDGGVIVSDGNGNRRQISADNIVLAMGFISNLTLRDQLEKEDGLEVFAAGDCIKPRYIFDAIHEGHLAARKV